jgi:hypothetical protein
MKKHVTVLLVVSTAILLIAGCGGGGGGGGGGGTVELCFQEWDHWLADTLNPPTSSNLVDTYDLIGFDVNFWEDGVLVLTLDENDVISFSGTMTITATTITQSITLEGSPFFATGSYTVTPAGATSGTFHITDLSGSYDFDFDISGNVLTTDSGLECAVVSADQSGINPLAVGTSNRMGSMLGDMFIY